MLRCTNGEVAAASMRAMPRGEAHGTARRAWTDAVLERVLDQRPHHQGRYQRGFEIPRNVDAHAQAPPHADLEDREEGPREHDLVAEPDFPLSSVATGRTQVFPEVA